MSVSSFKAVGNLLIGLMLPLFSVSAQAQIGQKIKSESQNGLIGLWRNSSMGFNMDLQFSPGGAGSFDDEVIQWSQSGTELMIQSNNVKTTYQVQLTASTLTLSGGDLDAPIPFERVGVSAPAPKTTSTEQVLQNTDSNSNKDALSGTWVADNEEITFSADGQFVYNGVPLPCTISQSQIQVSSPTGSVVFNYSVNGAELTLQNGGLTATYHRKGNAAKTGPIESAYSPLSVTGTEGVIDPVLVGKWAYIGTANNLSGSFSSETYITLHADGTYEYYSESSGSAYGSDMYGNQTFSGGMASQNSDRGTWRVNGNTIVAHSAQTGTKVYSLEKRNHPKNGDPMIILDGTAYVTYYQKEPWK